MRALAKLEQVLPARLRRRVDALQAATVTLAATAGPTVDPQALPLLAARLPRPGAPALRLPRRATATESGARSSRTGSSTSAAAGTWWRGTASASDWRTFRVDRLDAPAPAGARFAPRELPGRGRRRATSPRTCGAPYALRGAASRCTPRRRRWLERAPRSWGTVEPLGERRCELAHQRRQPRLARGARSRCSASSSRSTSRPSSSSASPAGGPIRARGEHWVAGGCRRRASSARRTRLGSRRLLERAARTAG